LSELLRPVLLSISMLVKDEWKLESEKIDENLGHYLVNENYFLYMTNLEKLSLSHCGQYLCPVKQCDLVEWLTWVIK